MTATNKTPAPAAECISAVILAGGRAARMGGRDKGLVEFDGEALVARIANAIAPQVAQVMINANRNRARYQNFGYRVIADRRGDYQGPLAGMHAALTAISRPWLLTLPCDGPFVAPDYAAAMLRAARADNVLLAVAHDGARMQPVHALIHRDLAADLGDFLQYGGRKIDLWHRRRQFAAVSFAQQQFMFANINTPQQLAELENTNRA